MPHRAVFLRRMLVRAGLTFVFLMIPVLIGAASFRGLLPAVVLPLVLALIFLLEDALRWRTVRFERWRIDGAHLIYEGAEGQAQIPLSDITAVTRRIGGRVVLTLRSGQHLMMRYLPFPDEIAEALRSALHRM